ncbi:hypothetical protein [Arthrobacter sp. B1805]|uniref:hypothetical protein n=1 Tax=Arthrobacter sp. B1805 TaxID=2058892 RepID=UPI000CE49D96|nr:hypothetical protein [Arthrobacter sp. B1805]
MNRSPFVDHPPASTAGKVAASLFVVVAAFLMALAAGAPWGAAAQGGSNPGVLPGALRVGSGVQGVVYLLLAGVAGTRWAGITVRRRVLHAAAALMVIGAMMNVASPSLLERMLWVPVTVALVIALWRAARDESLSSGSRVQIGHARRAA